MNIINENHEQQLLLKKEQQLLQELASSRNQVKAAEAGLREVREKLGYIQMPLLKSA